MIGLGYVGLPLAVEFAKLQACRRTGNPLKHRVIGFDINSQRLDELRSGPDHTAGDLREHGVSGRHRGGVRADPGARIWPTLQLRGAGGGLYVWLQPRAHQSGRYRAQAHQDHQGDRRQHGGSGGLGGWLLRLLAGHQPLAGLAMDTAGCAGAPLNISFMTPAPSRGRSSGSWNSAPAALHRSLETPDRLASNG